MALEKSEDCCACGVSKPVIIAVPSAQSSRRRLPFLSRAPRLSHKAVIIFLDCLFGKKVVFDFHGDVKLYTIHFIQTEAVNKRRAAPAGCMLQISS